MSKCREEAVSPARASDAAVATTMVMVGGFEWKGLATDGTGRRQSALLLGVFLSVGDDKHEDHFCFLRVWPLRAARDQHNNEDHNTLIV